MELYFAIHTHTHTYIYSRPARGKRSRRHFCALLQQPPPANDTHTLTHRENERDAANDKWEQQLVETATQKKTRKKVSGIFSFPLLHAGKIGVHSIQHKRQKKKKE